MRSYFSDDPAKRQKSRVTQSNNIVVAIDSTVRNVALRDSGSADNQSLVFNSHEWRRFINAAKAGRYDL